MLGTGRYWRALRWSGYIAVTSATLAVAIAYPMAIWLRRPFRGSLLLSALIKIPYFVPGLVAAFLLIMSSPITASSTNCSSARGSGPASPHAERQQWLCDHRAAGLKQFPLAFLLLAGSVASIPDSVLLAAQDLGAGSFDRLRKVVVPLTAKAMQAALILIFIGAAGDYTFQVVAGPTRENSLAALMVTYQGANHNDWNAAAVVGVTLMVLSLLGSVAFAGVVKLLTKPWSARDVPQNAEHVRRRRPDCNAGLLDRGALRHGSPLVARRSRNSLELPRHSAACPLLRALVILWETSSLKTALINSYTHPTLPGL